MFYILKSEFVIYQLHGAPLNAETVGGPGKNALLPPSLSGPADKLSIDRKKYGKP